ncbi:MAG: H/ACA RNA-protein complex component Gar1 [Candidatus Caldarchaeales archaeon]
MSRERVVTLGDVVRRLKDSVVLRAREVPEIGAPVYAEGQGRVGYVSNVFGRRERPYVEVRLESGAAKLGRLYVILKTRQGKG